MQPLKFFLSPKIRYLDQENKYPKRSFFEFFSSISWRLCTGTEVEKAVLFGLGTATKGEKLNIYSSNILNSPLIPVV
jgi:hypothetical protein